jgi:Mrp family chromosome partitioning ATPase
VIVDAPPSLLFADARIIARATDGVVLVLRANHTSWPSAAAAAQKLQMDGVAILGTVLNDWSPSPDTDAYGYRHLHKYYSRS